KRDLDRLAEPLRPQRHRHPTERPPRGALVAVLELHRDHAEAGAADAVCIQADAELTSEPGEPGGWLCSHGASEPHKASRLCAAFVTSVSRLQPVASADEHAA